ncbi:sugar diacid recognition domain-containing protein [Neobacillus niacini]|uniref:CdaR family transcriptional regulator n=1 Tax=Neobacillus niacini TaxID=86668 RepID=UPI00285F0511|nr:sugar diacid recognition domain-containing protein [Neobacillus niacini]MDR6999891.1 carbohydrate diacid regulator [Neobacillus niacini]
MLLSVSLAKKIIDEVKKLFYEDIIMVGVDGIIIVSTDAQRIGKYHEGAMISVKEKRRVIIKKEDEQYLQGAKAGINLPVFFLNNVIGVIGITGEPERVLPYGELLRKMTELLVQESYYSEQMQWQSRMLEAFVFDWLHARDWSSTFVERAKILNIDLQAKRQLILVQVTEQQDFFFKDIWQLTHVWNDPHDQDVLIHWGNDRLLIIRYVHQERERETITQKVKQFKAFIEETWKTPVIVGIGQDVDSSELTKGYEQAERALSVALKKTSIVFEEDLRLDICLEEISIPTRKEFTQRILQTVLTNEELLETFYTFFEQNMSLKLTASLQHIHINTLHYRIKKLEELTGLNLKYFPDVVSLYLALYFLEHQPKK